MIAIEALLLVASLQGAAQPAPSWPPPRGERVRVSTPTLQIKRRVAEYRGFGNDSLFLSTGRDSIGFPSLVVSRLEVPTGSHRRMTLGAVLGLGGGFLIGFALPRIVFGPYSGRDCGWVPCAEDFARGMARFLVGVTMTAGGLVIGLQTAWKHPATNWQSVPLPDR